MDPTGDQGVATCEGMKTHALILASLILATAAHAGELAEKPGPFTVKRDQAACMNLADWDRIQLYANDRNNPLERARAPRALAELSDPTNPKVGGGRVCTTIPKGTKVLVEKRIGRYECVRYEGQPPRHYEKTCIWTHAVTEGPGPMPAVDFYWY